MSGKITNEERIEITKHAASCSGSCPGLYTANTMAVAIEAMGMCLPNGSSNPALDPEKKKECERIGAAMKNLLVKNIKPTDIITRLEQNFQFCPFEQSVSNSSINCKHHRSIWKVSKIIIGQ